MGAVKGLNEGVQAGRTGCPGGDWNAVQRPALGQVGGTAESHQTNSVLSDGVSLSFASLQRALGAERGSSHYVDTHRARLERLR